VVNEPKKWWGTPKRYGGRKLRPDEVTVAGAKLLCKAVIRQAQRAYQSDPSLRPTSAERRWAKRDKRSAKRFFFSENSNFPWMAEGLDMDPRLIRMALLEADRDPDRTYEDFIDRASRLLD
jgi:hypothetical protein